MVDSPRREEGHVSTKKSDAVQKQHGCLHEKEKTTTNSVEQQRNNPLQNDGLNTTPQYWKGATYFLQPPPPPPTPAPRFTTTPATARPVANARRQRRRATKRFFACRSSCDTGGGAMTVVSSFSGYSPDLRKVMVAFHVFARAREIRQEQKSGGAEDRDILQQTFDNTYRVGSSADRVEIESQSSRACASKHGVRWCHDNSAC